MTIPFEAFEQEKLLLSTPLRLKEREVEFADNLVRFWELSQLGEAGDTIVGAIDINLRVFRNVLLALVALHPIRRKVNVLSSHKMYIVSHIFGLAGDVFFGDFPLGTLFLVFLLLLIEVSPTLHFFYIWRGNLNNYCLSF